MLFSMTPFILTINPSSVQIVFHGVVQYLLKFAIALCRMCIIYQCSAQFKLESFHIVALY